MSILNYSFKASRIGLLLVITLVPLFVSLGFWQLDRARVRESLIVFSHEQRQKPPLDRLALSEQEPESLRFRAIRLKGSYDPDHQLLVDNQILDGKPGYQVLVPFRPDGPGPWVLINRGWIPLGSSRTQVPVLDGLPVGPTEILGVFDLFHRVGLILPGMTTPQSGWPSVVQVPDPTAMRQRLDREIFLLQLRLDPGQPGSYSAFPWGQLPDPGKNRGYALQWWLFALAAFLLFLKASVHARSTS